MKKTLRKIAVLLLAAVLTIAPSTMAYASTTSQPALLSSGSGDGWVFKYWLFQPEARDVLPLQSVDLTDTTTGQPLFVVQPGWSFDFFVTVARGNFHCQVFRIGNNTAELVYSLNGAYSFYGNTFEPVDYPCAYIVRLTSSNPASMPNSQIVDYQCYWSY